MVSFLNFGQFFILTVISLVSLAAALVAFVHAAVQRPDAFPAVDKQSKTLWLVILGLAMVFIAFLGTLGFIVGIVAVLVYLVDVRPRVDSIQNKKWFRKV